MDILNGLLYINDVDVAVQYGAFLTEDSSAGHVNYDALLLPPKMKAQVAVNFREEDGEKLPDELPAQKYEPRDVTLFFAIIADTPGLWKLQYAKFLLLLRSGWLSLRVPELGKTYRMFVNGYSNYEQLTPVNASPVVCRFKVKFREPVPTF